MLGGGAIVIGIPKLNVYRASTEWWRVTYGVMGGLGT